MEREAGLARNSNKKLTHDRRRVRQRAKRKANREEILDMKCNDGVGIKDPTPFVAVLNLITRGKYIRVAGGFPIKSTIKEINKIKEVGV